MGMPATGCILVGFAHCLGRGGRDASGQERRHVQLLSDREVIQYEDGHFRIRHHVACLFGDGVGKH
jgi:hypothetical protein